MVDNEWYSQCRWANECIYFVAAQGTKRLPAFRAVEPESLVSLEKVVGFERRRLSRLFSLRRANLGLLPKRVLAKASPRRRLPSPKPRLSGQPAGTGSWVRASCSPRQGLGHASLGSPTSGSRRKANADAVKKKKSNATGRCNACVQKWFGLSSWSVMSCRVKVCPCHGESKWSLRSRNFPELRVSPPHRQKSKAFMMSTCQP